MSLESGGQHGDSATSFDAALIDLDGTLIDTLGDFTAALNRMLADLGLPPVHRAVVALRVGKGSLHLIESVLNHAIAQAGSAPIATDLVALQDRAWALYQEHYAAINGLHAQVYPGATEGLELLAQRGLKLACVTNKPTAFARTLLEAKGMAGHFAFIYGGDAFAHKKPHPMPLLRACEALGTLPARTLMVGDSINDAQSARAAGCPVALVTYGYNHGEPVAQAPHDWLVSSLADLEPLLSCPAARP